MVFTRHGHHIVGSVYDGPTNITKARCGGPGMCGPCSLDAEAWRNQDTKEAIESLEDRIQKLIDAWTIPGRRPAYHRQMQKSLRRDWPILGAALDKLADYMKESNK